MSIKQDIDTHPSIADLESDLEASAEKSPDLIVPSVQPKGSEFTLVTFVYSLRALLIPSSPASCMVLGGAFAVMFCSVGFINAFGVFQEYYKATFLKNKSASDICNVRWNLTYRILERQVWSTGMHYRHCYCFEPC